MKQSTFKSVLSRLSATCFFLVFFSLSSFSQVNTITRRLRDDLISHKLDDSEIKNYLSTLNADGSWKDIDYSNKSITNWQPVNHSGRLKTICTAYNKPSSIYYHDAGLKSSILSVINFYIAKKPESSNWWYNAIGSPLNLGPALLLMKTGDSFGFDQPTLDSFADALLNYFSESAIKWNFATTGANKIWLLNSSIHKASIENNEAVLAANFRSAFEEAKIMNGKEEGIKSDFSFYQHGPQLYCGGYGMSFLSDITYFGLLANGTEYQMNDLQLQTITNAVIEGFQWFCEKSAFDFGATGREISRPGAGSSSGLKTIITRLKTMNPSRSEDLADCYNFLDGKKAFAHPGTKHFWKSDIMVSHGKDFYLSARVPSRRTTGTERMNNENLKRKWLPWGATNIMTEGDEYRNLFPVWDWSSIPGVTSVKENIPGLPVTGGAYETSSAEFTGGVTDGVFGLAAYDYSWDGVEGRKAYFFTPEAMFCFGAGINASKTSPVITTLNQCFSSGKVTIKKYGQISTLEDPGLISSELSWIHHDKVGYLFPEGGDVTVKNSNQTGSWNDINLSQSGEAVTHKVFTSWIGHGNTPVNQTYQYIVVPSKNLNQFEKWTRNNMLKVLVNTSVVQCVVDKKAGICGLVFYQPGSFAPEPGLELSSDKACLILIQKINNGKSYKISVSDPTTKLKDLIIRISKELSGPGSIVNDDKTSSINVTFPSGDDAGRTVINEYQTRK